MQTERGGPRPRVSCMVAWNARTRASALGLWFDAFHMNDGNPILLVDDDENDLVLMETAFEQSKFGCPVQTFGDGQQLIEYLQRAMSESGGARLPSLVLLDLKMPGKNGFDVLAWAQGHARLKGIPFVVV